ncbi:hypothetical protein C8R47DRAFT_1285349, partial [Mycena vitilis]
MSESPDALQNLRAAYQILKRNVIRTLRTQRGSETQIDAQIHEVHQFFAAVELHRASIPPTEFATVEQSVTDMVASLNEVRHQSSDPPSGPSLVVTTYVPTGGRPRAELDRTLLSHALSLRGPTHLRDIFNVSARTIRRRAIDYNLVQPGVPVYTDTPQADGTVSRTYTSTSAAVSPLTDDALDTLLTDILRTFPNFGRRMISGRLRAAGHRVPRDRIAASYLRVHVIHCFIDGKSRYVTRIRVSNNNRAETVLQVFREAVALHGLPSRV